MRAVAVAGAREKKNLRTWFAIKFNIVSRRDAYDISNAEIEVVDKKNRIYCTDKLYRNVIYR